MEHLVHLERAAIQHRDHIILGEVNLTLKPGEFVYLIGQTGSGKTSLLKTLYGALPLKQGRGRILDFDLATLQRKQWPELRRRLGIIFQDFNLLIDRSGYENLLFVLKATGWTEKGKMRRRIEQVINRVGLSEQIHKMPHELSGGERQRVVIARALLNEPAIILADEPTGNLDPETSNDIMELIHRLAREKKTGVLFATHDYRLIEKFPGRILCCVNGNLIDDVKFVG